MSKIRINAELIFGDTLNYFKFLDFKKGLKLSAIGKMYLVCAILQNAHACLHGNKTSKYFPLNKFQQIIPLLLDQEELCLLDLLCL